jgi:DNA-binding NtrC family response regulator
MYTDTINAGANLNHNHQNNQNNQPKIFIIDHDQKYGQRLLDWLTGLKVEAGFAASLPPAGQTDKSLKNTILIVSDQFLQGEECSELQALKRAFPQLTVMVLTPPLPANHYVACLQSGLIDYICSRNNLPSIFSAVRAELARRQLQQENEFYLKKLTS